jgi:hypothetical protein
MLPHMSTIFLERGFASIPNPNRAPHFQSDDCFGSTCVIPSGAHGNLQVFIRKSYNAAEPVLQRGGVSHEATCGISGTEFQRGLDFNDRALSSHGIVRVRVEV